jgi:hypothetical protein
VNLMNLVNFVTVLDGPECQYAGQRTGRTARRIPASGAIGEMFSVLGEAFAQCHTAVNAVGRSEWSASPQSRDRSSRSENAQLCAITVRNNSHVDDYEELPSRSPLGDRDLAVQRRMPAAAAQFGVRLRGSCYLKRRSSWMNRSTSRAPTPPAIAAVGNCERDFRSTTIDRPDRLGEARRNESSGVAMDAARTVFPALASTNHRFELGPGTRKSTSKPC